jgi:hypothetical protein
MDFCSKIIPLRGHSSPPFHLKVLESSKRG